MASGGATCFPTSGPDVSHSNQWCPSNQRCPVINCEVSVRCRRELEEHLGESHSACNPCRHFNKGRLVRILDGFVCPVCLLRFTSRQLCLKHMVDADHKVLMNPLPIAAYACPQCLLLFPSHTLCLEHIQEAKHHSYTFAFKDDEGRSEGVPVPMPDSVAKEFVSRCERSPWILECITCGKKIDTTIGGGGIEIGRHLRREHRLVSTTHLTPSDVFGQHMIKAYSCVQCLRLFDALPGGQFDAIHECMTGAAGMYVEAASNCSSFEQYVTCCGLAPIVEPRSNNSFLTAFSPPGKRCCNDNELPVNRKHHLSSDGRLEKTTVKSPMVSLASSLFNDDTAEMGVGKKGSVAVDIAPLPSAPLPSPESDIPANLHTMRQIVFLDLDNWLGFWTRLPRCLPGRTFVWGFYGGATSWIEPKSIEFLHAKSHGLWHVHKRCSDRKDAADFAICVMVGKMDERLPKHIPFTILSGDRGFLELENLMRSSARRAVVINPHHRSNSQVYALICSAGDA